GFPCQQVLASGGGAGVGVESSFSLVYTGENRLKGVVFRLGDWIELMVVAAGTMYRRAHEGGHGRRDHGVPVEVGGSLSIDGVISDVTKGTLVPRPGGQKPGGDNCLRIVGIQNIAGDLFQDKAGVRFIFIERTNEVVPIGPGVGPGAVLV